VGEGKGQASEQSARVTVRSGSVAIGHVQAFLREGPELGAVDLEITSLATAPKGQQDRPNQPSHLYLLPM
jgi:hypothetical protein